MRNDYGMPTPRGNSIVHTLIDAVQHSPLEGAAAWDYCVERLSAIAHKYPQAVTEPVLDRIRKALSL